MISVYTTFYHEHDTDRREEYLSCMRLNLDCKAVGRVFVINENGNLSEFKSTKLSVIPMESRPTYKDLFYMINQTVDDSDISIIANTDIYFDHNISALNRLNFNNRCFALSRWDIGPDGKAVLYDRNDSQDVWVFKGKIKKVQADFGIGVPRCDNRVAYELEKAGYQIENPSFSIKCYHVHAGERKEYSTLNLPEFISPPYKYIWPHNLFSLSGTLWHNLIHPSGRVYYRVDMRKINQWLVMRAFGKAMGAIRRRKSGSRKATHGS